MPAAKAAAVLHHGWYLQYHFVCDACMCWFVKREAHPPEIPLLPFLPLSSPTSEAFAHQPANLGRYKQTTYMHLEAHNMYHTDKANANTYYFTVGLPSGHLLLTPATYLQRNTKGVKTNITYFWYFISADRCSTYRSFEFTCG